MKKRDKEAIRLEDGSVVMAQMPVIISASRSTDIPAFYADWFMSRIRKQDGYIQWFNPFNGVPLYVGFRQMRLIVFWSKNPKNMIPYLKELDSLGYNYYFQYTLNNYVAEGIEPGIRDGLQTRIDTFKRISDHVGPDRVVWRFDPLLLTKSLDVNGVMGRIEDLGDQLHHYTSRLVFSFIDIARYKRVARNLNEGGINAREFSEEEMCFAAKRIGELALCWKINVGTCGEIKDLSAYGIEHNRCIDDRLIAKCFPHDVALMEYIGRSAQQEFDFRTDKLKDCDDAAYRKIKDKGQRMSCGCIASKDIGEYNTCPHLCHYCYANVSGEAAKENWRRHLANPNAPTITGRLI